MPLNIFQELKQLNIYKKVVLFLFTAVWVWSAIGPRHLSDWILENILIVILLVVLFSFRKKTNFSNISFAFIFIYLSLHTVGAHYTYSEVPFGFMLQDWLGSTRNMYDRLVHFLYGFLLVVPTWELYSRISNQKGFLSYYIPVQMILATSALYEMMEWFAAKTVSPELGLAFVGAQGDIWDAQKDMWLAFLGACIMMGIVQKIKTPPVRR